MERNEFIEGFVKISSDCNRMTEKHDIHYLIDNTNAATNIRGRKTLVIVMEELAELSKEVAKVYRDKVDYFNLLQEMGDVLICLDSLQDIFGISDEDLQKAKNVKLARNMQRVKDNGTFD